MKQDQVEQDQVSSEEQLDMGFFTGPDCFSEQTGRLRSRESDPRIAGTGCEHQTSTFLTETLTASAKLLRMLLRNSADGATQNCDPTRMVWLCLPCGKCSKTGSSPL